MTYACQTACTHCLNAAIAYCKTKIDIHVGWEAIALIKQTDLPQQPAPESHTYSVYDFDFQGRTLLKMAQVFRVQSPDAGNTHAAIRKNLRQRREHVAGQLDTAIEQQYM